jgi:hypothetical protein
MERLALVVVLAVVAIGVAFVLQRRRTPPEPANTGSLVPDRLDRRDFPRADAPWLVAVFTSATCSTCAGVWDKARHLASDQVVVHEVEVTAARDLHRRYDITAVPAVMIADAEGVVRASFLGPVTATDLWARLAELREPGTLPADGCAADPDRSSGGAGTASGGAGR